MGIRLVGARDAGAAKHDGSARWTCAVVNNMPDAAFCATERQFVGLLAAGSGNETVAITRYAVAGVPRGERIQAQIAAEYSPLALGGRKRPPTACLDAGSTPFPCALPLTDRIGRRP